MNKVSCQCCFWFVQGGVTLLQVVAEAKVYAVGMKSDHVVFLSLLGGVRKTSESMYNGATRKYDGTQEIG